MIKHTGIFENKTGKQNEKEFETQVNNILNQATQTAGKIGRPVSAKTIVCKNGSCWLKRQ